MASRRMTRFGVAASVAAVVLSLSASAALAGDITGNGKFIAGSDAAPLNGKSHCAYSGLNDEYYILGDLTQTRTQSWGRIPKSGDGFFTRDNLTAFGFNPGIACNPMKAGSHP